MTSPLRPPPPISDAHKALMFPTLAPAQVARTTAHGTVRAVAAEQVLIEAGDAIVPFFVVRSGGLADTMSRYLIRRIEESPSISLTTHTEITDLEGNGHLERVHVQDKNSAALQTLDIRHVFMMTGALPNTAWLDGCIALDSKGFIKTGPDLTPDDLTSAQWPLTRPPFLLETSRPGVFAVGDVRGGNLKRVASAVGEGSIAVSFVHRVLAE